MAIQTLAQFMADAGERPYRELVEHHVRKQSTEALRVASMGEIAQLPEQMQARALSYIDTVNERVGYDPAFWREATCRQANGCFVEAALEVFGLVDGVGFADDGSAQLDDDQLGMVLFQMSTLSFAYSASTQRAQRKFMGISKNWFG